MFRPIMLRSLLLQTKQIIIVSPVFIVTIVQANELQKDRWVHNKGIDQLEIYRRMNLR